MVEAVERARAGWGFAPIACDGAASGECGRFSFSADMVEDAETEGRGSGSGRKEAEFCEVEAGGILCVSLWCS
jgi:hypothetical protein